MYRKFSILKTYSIIRQGVFGNGKDIRFYCILFRLLLFVLFYGICCYREVLIVCYSIDMQKLREFERMARRQQKPVRQDDSAPSLHVSDKLFGDPVKVCDHVSIKSRCLSCI